MKEILAELNKIARIFNAGSYKDYQSLLKKITKDNFTNLPYDKNLMKNIKAMLKELGGSGKLLGYLDKVIERFSKFTRKMDPDIYEVLEDLLYESYEDFYKQYQKENKIIEENLKGLK